MDPSVLAGVTQPLPTEFHVYQLDAAALRAILANAPPEGRRAAAPAAAIATMPLADGTFARMAFERSPLLGPDLAARYPSIKTYSFRGVDDPSLIGKLTGTSADFQALMRATSDAIRIHTVQTSTGTFYLAYLNRNRTDGADDYGHDPDEHHGGTPPPARDRGLSLSHVIPALTVHTGETLRTYRLVVATTSDYYLGRVGSGGASDVVSSIVAEVNNANAVFEAEVAVSMQLTNTILFSDPSTDPYTAGATPCQLRDENPAIVNGVISPSDYDIGFVFGAGSNFGCAWYVVCLSDKARGAGRINLANPVGSSTGLLVHEMGHQLGAHHTFSGGAAGCTAGEFSAGSADEPGSGTTIMSYRGNCGSDNVDTTAPALPAGRYYNTHNFDEIVTNTTSGSGSTCGTTSATGNLAPVVNAGTGYTIPRGTPFTLTGSAVDPDGDPLTYNWEQLDFASTQRPIDTDPGNGPILRSVPPSDDGASRTFPNLNDILAGTQRKGEILPSTDRTLTFRLTARDNRTGGGGVAYDTAVLTVAGDPFVITSPNGGETFGAACTIPVSWTVGGGSVASQVDLGFSSNGGKTFTALLSGTPNDGSADVVAPCVNSTKARLKASAVGNVFFDISDADFTVVRRPPVVSVSATGGEVDAKCQFTVPFTAKVTDDCGTDASAVTVEAIPKGSNFSMGPVTFTAVQASSTEVDVTGSVLVYGVSNSPAILDIKVSGADACGDKGSHTSEVQVTDTTPPTITASVSPATLWPPDHKMDMIHASVTVQDNCPGVSYALTSITSSEADSDLSGDILASFGTPDTVFSLRAERLGGGTGRIYTITYTATDASQNQTSTQTTVVVPHDKRP